MRRARLVFKAYTDPAAVAQWWGLAQCHHARGGDGRAPGRQVALRAGEADGKEYAFYGEYREVVPPERLVATFESEGFPGKVTVDATTFEERDGKTLLTTRSRFDSVEDRDGMLASGMESGAVETWTGWPSMQTLKA